ncbi:MAG: rRNA maturation RNase YbeY [Ignavibacteria bacterium]|nr:rRNA maturation RNase YbeY [Ignavibacteria bacterium]
MVEVSVVNAHRRYRIPASPIRHYVRKVLTDEKKPRARVSVVCIDSRRCRRLNRRYLGHDYSTDVLTFPLEEGVNLEGEIYVNLDRVRQQAREYNVSFRHELARLIIHGVLHLAGYDDTGPAKSKRMKKAENRYLEHWFGSAQARNVR